MIADPQSVIWTPSMWLPAILSDKPSMRLVDRVHLAHLLIGAMAIFAYGRLRGWRDEASLIAAISFMMSGPLAVRLEHLLMTVSTMWIAIALWRLEAAIQFGGFWRGIAFGAPLGLLLIDRNHVAFLGALFLFFYWLSRLDLRAPMALRRHGSVIVGGTFGGDFTLKIHRGMIYLYGGTLASLLILWIGVARRQLLAPGIRLFRRPSDALFIFGIIISLIVGAFLDRALTLPRVQPERGSTILAVSLLMVAITPLVFISASFERIDELMHDIALFGALSIGFAALIIWARRSDRWRTLALTLLFVGVSGDLIYFNSKTILSAWRPPHYQPMETPENDPFFSQLPALLAEPDPNGAPWRVELLGLGHTVQNIGQVDGISNLLGYNPIRLESFERYIGPDMQNSAANIRKWGERMTGYNSAMTDRLGLRYIVTGKPIEEIDPTIDADRFQLIDKVKRRRRTAFVYANPNAQARATLIDTEGNPLEGTVRFEHYGHTELRLSVTAPKAGSLVLAEFDYPGWQAQVNGESVLIERHQDIFRAVPIAIGESDVVLTFNALLWQNLKDAARGILHRAGS